MRDMISVASGFQYSVNIGYDIGDDSKLKNFIPTKSAITLLEDILLSVNPASSERARVLIGAYGKGKSHIVLAILSLLMKRDLSLFVKLKPKLKERPKLYQLVLNYYESHNKILPIVISGSNTSLTQAFLLSLQRTLSEHDLLSAMPETNYKAAAGVIRRWEKEFPDTLKRFQSNIDEPVEKFLERLEAFDVPAYETFERIYPSLTAGSLFNPFLGFDVVELYESVAKGIKSKGYTGIYVVYDEFSKFLEANIVDASVSDTKMLQDFAEKCCRSGDLQMHLMLISHKEISNYIDRLPKEKTDGWRGVSERFKHIHLNNNFSQTYEIISSVIQHKEPKWTSFCEEHESEFEALNSRYLKHQMFADAQGEFDIAVKGCFPLHPVSTFILPRLSERVAQNERTLFTFLSAEGSATLAAFLDSYKNDFTLVTPDLIYDYFEPLLKKEVYAGEIHDTFILTSTILNQISNDTLGCKIIKTISLIYILEQFERLCPTKEQIIGIYSGSYDVDEINRSISELIEKEFVVYIKKSNSYLRLKQSSGVDIHQKIHDMVASRSGKITEHGVLNDANFDNYMYPSRYNDEKQMTRFFSFQFISGAEVTRDINWDVKSEPIKADGVIYGIIPESEEQISQLLEVLKSSSASYNRYIFILPKHFCSIKDSIYEYDAVARLREQAAGVPVLFDEYEVIFEDLQEVIKAFISSYTHPENYSSVYVYKGEEQSIQRRSGLTEVMSTICDTVYGLTPVIINESVNKNDITSIALNSRNKIIRALLRNELEPNLGLSGTGQEVSIMRSTLVRTGVWIENDGNPQINLRPENDAMRNMLATIENFILEARQGKHHSFNLLYERLTSPKYHIGLRYGLIPIYIALVMHQYRQQVVINEVINNSSVAGPTTVDVLLQINSAPEKFTLEFLDWDQEKEEYITGLGSIFAEYVIEADKNGNFYDYVAKAMHRWCMSLPKYSKECVKKPSGESLQRQQLGLIRMLKLNTGSSELLFRKLPEMLGTNDYQKVVAGVADIKREYDGLLDELKQYLINQTREEFLPDNDTGRKISLLDVVKEWCDHLSPKCFEQLFADRTDRFLRELRNETNDEDMFISQLAKLATGLRIEDWDENSSNRYLQALRRFITTAKGFHGDVVAETDNNTSIYEITFQDSDGATTTATTRRFQKVVVSHLGKMLFNQITAALDQMGQSVPEQEKRQVLMEVLKTIC